MLATRNVSHSSLLPASCARRMMPAEASAVQPGDFAPWQSQVHDISSENESRHCSDAVEIFAPLAAAAKVAPTLVEAPASAVGQHHVDYTRTYSRNAGLVVLRDASMAAGLSAV